MENAVWLIFKKRPNPKTQKPKASSAFVREQTQWPIDISRRGVLVLASGPAQTSNERSGSIGKTTVLFARSGRPLKIHHPRFEPIKDECHLQRGRTSDPFRRRWATSLP